MKYFKRNVHKHENKRTVMSKKLIGVFGITVIVMTLFFNSSAKMSNHSDIDLSGLLALNIASAEVTAVDGCVNWNNGHCTVNVNTYNNCTEGELGWFDTWEDDCYN